MFRQFATPFLIALLALFTGPALAAVEVNQATQAQLEGIKGVGPALSARILEARKAGSFKSWADFRDRVSGVGEGNAAKLSKAGLTVAGSAYEPKGTAAAGSRKAEAPADRATSRSPATTTAPPQAAAARPAAPARP